MRTKILIVVLALILGGVAAVMAARYLDDARSTIAADSEPVQVLVAQEDIPRGMNAEELLASEAIMLEEVPQRYVASGAISSERALNGQVLAQPLTEGEQVTRGRFELPSAAGLAYSIPADYIALSLPVDEVKGVSGLLKPGDHVALLVYFDMGPDDVSISKILLRDAKVLAVGGTLRQVEDAAAADESGGGVLSASRDDSTEATLNTRTVTVAVSALDAERIIFAEEEGQVYCALLPATGEDLDVTTGSTMETVLD